MYRVRVAVLVASCAFSCGAVTNAQEVACAARAECKPGMGETDFMVTGSEELNRLVADCSCGAVQRWTYCTLAGIMPDPSDPDCKKIILAPRPDPKVGAIAARCRLKAGVVESAWAYGLDGICRWRFTVPAGVVATIRYPDGTGETVREGKHERVIR